MNSIKLIISSKERAFSTVDDPSVRQIHSLTSASQIEPYTRGYQVITPRKTTTTTLKQKTTRQTLK